MIIGMSMGQETCRILGQVSLNVPYLKKIFLKDFCGPGRDWRENKRHPDQIIYGQSSGKTMGKNAKLKEKQKWSNEKLHLDNARELRGIYCIDPEEKE